MNSLVSENYLEITTRIGCKIKCIYCPQTLLAKRYREKYADSKLDMSIDTFKRCINKLPPETRIDFSGMCEPWLNPNCTEMLIYAKEKKHPIVVFTTLNGVTKKDWRIIKSIKYEYFVIHLPDNQLNSSIPITQEYLEILKDAVTIKVDNGQSFVSHYSCHGEIHPAIVDIIPQNAIIYQEMHDRAGNIKHTSLPHYKHSGMIICTRCNFALNHNVLLPNGAVLLCCMDYGMKHIFGNLLEQTWEELRMSKERKLLRKAFFDTSIDTLCRSCISAVPIGASNQSRTIDHTHG